MPIRLDEDVVEDARIVAAHRGCDMKALVCDILRPALQRMKREELEKAMAGLDKTSKAPKSKD